MALGTNEPAVASVEPGSPSGAAVLPLRPGALLPSPMSIDGSAVEVVVVVVDCAAEAL